MPEDDPVQILGRLYELEAGYRSDAADPAKTREEQEQAEQLLQIVLIWIDEQENLLGMWKLVAGQDAGEFEKVQISQKLAELLSLARKTSNDLSCSARERRESDEVLKMVEMWTCLEDEALSRLIARRATSATHGADDLADMRQASVKKLGRIWAKLKGVAIIAEKPEYLLLSCWSLAIGVGDLLSYTQYSASMLFFVGLIGLGNWFIGYWDRWRR